MTKDEFDSLIEIAREQNGEWSTEDAVEMSFREAGELAEAVAEYRKLKQIRELIENRGKKQAGKQAKKQAGKRAIKRAMKQAMMNWDE